MFFSLFFVYIHAVYSGIFNLFKSVFDWFRNTKFLLRVNEVKHPD